ncbi:MAG: hypothetical protein ACM3W4_05470 [Ignavibacteriales bacterium]
MSDYERETRTSTPSGDAYQRERTTVDDTPERTVVVRRGSNAGAWLLAALVAIVAIIAVVWMMTSRTAPTNDEIAAAMDQSRAAGYVEGAQTAMSNLPQTTLPAPPAVDTGSVIASQTAADAARAASEARAAAERAAESAQNAAANVSANATTDTNTTP